MRYVITGGSGFIGSNLALRLLEDEHEVVIIDIKVPQIPEHKNLTFHQTEINACNIPWCFEGADAVIHLAAEPGVQNSIDNPEKNFKTNIMGTHYCLEAARETGIDRFIFASSGGTVVGSHEPPIHEDLFPNPVTPYGAAKLTGESLCKAYYKSYGLETVMLRFSNVYGPYSMHKPFNLIPGFYMDAIEDNIFHIHGDGKSMKDFIYVDDLVDGIILSLNTKEAAGEVLQIATGVGFSVNDVITIMNTYVLEHLNRPAKIIYAVGRPGDINYGYCDISKAKKLIGFEPKNSIYFGLLKTFKWFLEKYDKQ